MSWVQRLTGPQLKWERIRKMSDEQVDGELQQAGIDVRPAIEKVKRALHACNCPWRKYRPKGFRPKEEGPWWYKPPIGKPILVRVIGGSAVPFRALYNYASVALTDMKGRWCGPIPDPVE